GGADPAVILLSFYAYQPQYSGGISVASGDVNGDGRADVITGIGPGGGPHVQAFSGKDPSVILASFYAYDPKYAGGVYVAAGDVNGDGKADIITGIGIGGGPHVPAVDAPTLANLASSLAYAPTVASGVRVAAADLDGDGVAEIVTGPGLGSPPLVQAFTAAGVLRTSILAYDADFLGGVFVG